ncbi:transcriptional regulator [Enterobacter bugandensis]
MRYLIEKKMLVTEDGVTTPGLKSTEHELSSLPYRLLCFFIANKSRLVTREELFIQIWEKHDLIPSGTALATQISSLRKLMARYGIADDILLTKPKQGFIFNATVETIVEEEEIPPVKARNTHNRLRAWGIGLGACFALGIIVYVIHAWLGESSSIQWYRIGTVKTCTIYAPGDDMSLPVTSYYLRKAGEFLQENEIKCGMHDKILEYIQHPGISEINDVYETKQFYAYCQWMKESYICNNTYYSAGKTK